MRNKQEISQQLSGHLLVHLSSNLFLHSNLMLGQFLEHLAILLCDCLAKVSKSIVYTFASISSKRLLTPSPHPATHRQQRVIYSRPALTVYGLLLITTNFSTRYTQSCSRKGISIQRSGIAPVYLPVSAW